MTPTTAHDEPEEMMCEWAWTDLLDAWLPSCSTSATYPYDAPTHCPGCGLRVREIEGEGE